jgi:5-methylcytosine-specific restriction enzyme subunit McrC
MDTKMPDRTDVNQVILYGVRYSTNCVMLLHADRIKGRKSTELCGEVGGFEVYNGMIDLKAVPVEDEEHAFVTAIRALL